MRSLLEITAKMRCGVIIVAAGRGERLGVDLPKAFVPLGSKPLFQYSLETFLAHPKISETVLVVPKERLDSFGNGKYKVVAGGQTRQASVANGLNALSPAIGWVYVHDAARPFVTKEIIDRLLERAEARQNSIAAWPISDTVKVSKENLIVKTVERQNLWGAQTPQAFSTDVLREALGKANQDGFEGTDEASLVERLGIPVELVLGDSLNIKITTPEDWKLAESILERGL